MDELYDLKNDPYEMKNLIKNKAAQKALEKMQRELERLLKESHKAQGLKASISDF